MSFSSSMDLDLDLDSKSNPTYDFDLDLDSKLDFDAADDADDFDADPDFDAVDDDFDDDDFDDPEYADSDFDSGDDPILHAESGCYNELKRWLDDGTDPTEVLCAATRGNSVTVQLILDYGADVQHENVDGFTALHGAVAWGKHDIARVLLRNGARVNHRDSQEGFTSLRWAVDSYYYGDVLETVRVLLDYGAYTDYQDFDGFTPLHIACKSNLLSVVSLLLSRGARTDIRNNCGKTAIDYCKKDTDVYNLLKRVSLHKKQNIYAMRAIYRACNML